MRWLKTINDQHYVVVVVLTNILPVPRDEAAGGAQEGEPLRPLVK